MDVVSVIAWTCKRCAHHVEGLSVEEYMAASAAHVCKPADEIRRAARYFRRRSPLLGKVADWLEYCAGMAARVTDPRLQEEIADPHALAVARDTPWEAES